MESHIHVSRCIEDKWNDEAKLQDYVDSVIINLMFI